MSEPDISSVIPRLREALVGLRASEFNSQIVIPQAQVMERFGPVFAFDHVGSITAEQFAPFLYFDNNRHWTGLHRQVNRLCEDIGKLNNALRILLDEKRPIAERMDDVVKVAPSGLGKGIMTAILHVAHPDKYGVWNNTSEGALATLGIFPDFPRGSSFGEKYRQINELLVRLAAALDTDLWTLDALWWFLQQRDERSPDVPAEIAPAALVETNSVALAEPRMSTAGQLFGLERHLHDFLRDNWDNLELGKEWRLHTEPGDDEAGYEYACSIGRIDLLAKHRTLPRWLVVELKRKDTTDSVVGQVLRYIGWVRHHLAAPGEDVHGLIIAHSGDEPLRYAVSAVPNLQFMTYEVEFRLRAENLSGRGVE